MISVTLLHTHLNAVPEGDQMGGPGECVSHWGGLDVLQEAEPADELTSHISDLGDLGHTLTLLELCDSPGHEREGVKVILVFIRL